MKTAQYAFCQNGEINLSDDGFDETETLPAGTDFDVSPSETQIQTSSSFTYGSLRQISANPVLDGRNLAARCLALMRPASSSLHFVPHLFILIASTAYQWLRCCQCGGTRRTYFKNFFVVCFHISPKFYQ